MAQENNKTNNVDTDLYTLGKGNTVFRNTSSSKSEAYNDDYNVKIKIIRIVQLEGTMFDAYFDIETIRPILEFIYKKLVY